MHSRRIFRLGTRGSQLALWQARSRRRAPRRDRRPAVRDRRHPDIRRSAAGRAAVRSRRQAAVRQGDRGRAAARARSTSPSTAARTCPRRSSDGLTIAGVLPREDPRDAVVLPSAIEGPGVSAEFSGVDELRRHPRPDAVDRHQQRAADRAADAAASRRPVRADPRQPRHPAAEAGCRRATMRIVLAAAGLRRLGFGSRISFALPAAACVPAPGQGIIAIEIRAEDATVQAGGRRHHDRLAAAALEAERGVVEALGGGCQTPIGALAHPVDGDALELAAAVIALDGSRIVARQPSRTRAEAGPLGAASRRQFIADGAADILAEHVARRAQGSLIASVYSNAEHRLSDRRGAGRSGTDHGARPAVPGERGRRVCTTTSCIRGCSRTRAPTPRRSTSAWRRRSRSSRRRSAICSPRRRAKARWSRG